MGECRGGRSRWGRITWTQTGIQQSIKWHYVYINTTHLGRGDNKSDEKFQCKPSNKNCFSHTEKEVFFLSAIFWCFLIYFSHYYPGKSEVNIEIYFHIKNHKSLSYTATENKHKASIPIQNIKYQSKCKLFISTYFQISTVC